MKHQHTPGPWSKVGELLATDENLKHACLQAKNGRWTALVEIEDTEGEANARLIAAAPELLEALIILIDYTQQGHKGGLHPLEMAENAVRKATNLFSTQIKG